MGQFRGGPLEDGRQSQIHSLVVYMRGDGRSTIGAYVRVYDGEVPLGVFEWHPENPELTGLANIIGNSEALHSMPTPPDEDDFATDEEYCAALDAFYDTQFWKATRT